MIAVYIAIGAIQKITIAPIKKELLQTTNALEEAEKPSEIELLKQKLEDNRESRKQLQSKIDELVSQKNKKAEQVDEIKKQIEDILGLN